MKWFRFWTDTLDDVKILHLSDYEYRIWTYLLAIASEVNSMSGECQVNVKSMSLRCRTQVNHFSRALETFQKLGLISINEAGFPVITNWDKRQFKSDNAYERVKKHRDLTPKRNVSCNGFETPPETDTETDTDKKESIKKKRKLTLTDDQWLDAIKKNPAYGSINIETEKGKCEAWCLTNGKMMSRRRLVNWLNRAEKPMAKTYNRQRPGSSGQGQANELQPLPEYKPESEPEVDEETRAKRLAEIAEFSKKFGRPGA